MVESEPKGTTSPVTLTNREEARLKEVIKDPDELEFIMSEVQLMGPTFVQEFLDEYDHLKEEFESFDIEVR